MPSTIDDLFEDLGESVAEYKEQPTNPATIRTRACRERTKAKIAALEEARFPEPMSPLEFMLHIVSDPNEPMQRRMKAAIAAAPFCHENLSKAPPKKGIKQVRQEAADKATKSGVFQTHEGPNIVKLHTK